MAEYVSKDQIYELCQPSGVCRLHVSMIDQMPAADVVEVVRCKDCIYHDNKGEDVVFCANFLKDMIPDDYCSVGEREDQDED